MGSFSKYRHIFLIHWLEQLEYRGELILWAVINAMPIAAMIFLWMSVYSSGDSVGGYELNQLLTYYLGGYLISRFIVTNIELEYVNQIRTGTVSKFLIKPLSLPVYILLEEFSWRVLNIVIAVIPAIVLLLVFFPQVFIVPDFSSGFLIVITLVMAFCLNILLSLLIVAGSFFLDQGRVLSHFKWMMAGILNGSLLPLDLYPEWLRRLAIALPFQLQFSLPMDIYLGTRTIDTVINSLATSLIWIVFLGMFTAWFWRMAMHKFTAVGG